ncbi:MAG: preprotein translocase subunit SecG [Verrucomicrobiota bacterium]
MILAAVGLEISITLLIILHVVVSLLMILVVMMQRPKQEGLGAAFGGGMTDQLLGAGTTSFLQKATVWLGALFFLVSLVLAILIGKQNQAKGLMVESATPLEELAEAPAVPEGVELEVGDEAAAAESELMKELEAAESEGATVEEDAASEEAAAPESVEGAAEVAPDAEVVEEKALEEEVAVEEEAVVEDESVESASESEPTEGE